MIFFFIYNTVCKNVFDFRNITQTRSLLIRLYSLESVEIKIRHLCHGYFPDLINLYDLHLNIETEDFNGKKKTYDELMYSDKVTGVFFKDKNCTLRFYNSGPDLISFHFNSYRGSTEEEIEGLKYVSTYKTETNLFYFIIFIFIPLIYFIFFMYSCYRYCKEI